VQVVTGISAKDAKAVAEPENEWTVDELKAGKPFLVYYYVAQKADAKPGAGCSDDNYGFAQKAEFQAFGGDKTIETINTRWIPKKIEIDADADHKLEKNQARIEFWSFTQKKLDVITLKARAQLSGSAFDVKLKQLESKNRDVCTAEIKRINDEIERRKKEEAATASK
jgi:hypothetical protein